MQVILDYAQPLVIDGLKPGDKIRLDDDLTVDDFLNKLDFNGASLSEIQPYLNGEKIDFSASLNHGDQLFLEPQ